MHCQVITHNPGLLPLNIATRMPTTTGRFLLFSLIAAILAGLAFVPGLPGNFLFDDIPNIVNNEALHLTALTPEALFQVAFSQQFSGSMRVLPTLSFALDYWRVGGADPATFKTTNIILQVLTAFALAGFFRSLMLAAGIAPARASWAAMALAFAWAAHPLQVSSVLYVVQRMQTMGTFFLLLALWVYLESRRAQLDGRPSRRGFLVVILLWLLAMGCKEDTVLLPAYTLALELTVLRFSTSDARLDRMLRRGYLAAVIAGVAAYALLVIPHYWHWDSYPGRTFSTLERLLTQARVLCMYLWQIIVPLPQHMPFYYDGLQPSRGLLQPWTTLASIIAVLALIGAAWRLRVRWPLFSLGVFIFFGAHFIASNVISLELAFEHRNHFALIGAVLAIGSLVAHAGTRLRAGRVAQAAVCAALLVFLAATTMQRAHSWNGTLQFARTSVEIAPRSARAWIALCAGYFQTGGSVGAGRANPNLDQAIETCAAGSSAAPYALNSPALLVVLKSIRGDITPQDWDRFQQRLEVVPMTFDNRRAPQILTYHALNGVALDKQRMLRMLSTLVQRAPLSPPEVSSIGYFVMNDLGEPGLSIPYFIRAMDNAPSYDPFPQTLAADLRKKGRPDLAEKIEKHATARLKAADSPGGGANEQK